MVKNLSANAGDAKDASSIPGLESETVINVHPKFRIEVTTVHAGGDGEKG